MTKPIRVNDANEPGLGAGGRCAQRGTGGFPFCRRKTDLNSACRLTNEECM